MHCNFWKKNNIDEITAWIVSKNKLNNLNKTISKKLPNYMIPRKFNFIENFPINLNGKIDKVSLKKVIMIKKDLIGLIQKVSGKKLS